MAPQAILALTITLLIFSGRPDPEWQIQQGDPNFQTTYDALQNAKKNNLTMSFNQMPARLGYKGFLVREANQSLAETSIIYGPNTKQLQKLLLQTGAKKMRISKYLVKVIKKIIN